MKKLEYDSESDSLYVNISSLKAYLTAEVSPRIGVDLSPDGRPVGVEILEASKVISQLLLEKIKKEDVKHLLCTISEGDALYLNFQLDDKKATLAIPKAYQSPVLTDTN